MIMIQICKLYAEYMGIIQQQKKIQEKIIGAILLNVHLVMKIRLIMFIMNVMEFFIILLQKAVVHKIKRIGLIPKHLDKKISHPGRVYFSVFKEVDYRKILEL